MPDDKTTVAEASQQKPAATPPAPRAEGLWQPLAALREEMDQLFDNFWRGAGFGTGRAPMRMGAQPQPLRRLEAFLGTTIPHVDVVEGEKEYRIVAELPGMGPGDVELSVSGDVLTIKGEKKEEKEEKTESYHVSERRFGSFSRSFQIPQGVDQGSVAAAYDKGVLTVTLPKTPEAAQHPRRIEVKLATPA